MKRVVDLPPSDILFTYSDPYLAQMKAILYLGKNAILYKSSNKNKKYTIVDPSNNKMISFGQIGYEDYTFHKNEARQQNYLKRTNSISGNWKSNKYSPNNLSRNILW